MDQARPDEQLSKLMLQLEELGSRFGEFDQFIEQLATKREDVYEAFSSKKQSLVDARQRRAQWIQADERVLEGIVRHHHPPARPRAVLTPLAEPEGPFGYPRPEVAR
ncbi:MAG: hypothetical protein GY856_00400 [bacterium]|nr:hypothetical protein [bacterium]